MKIKGDDSVALIPGRGSEETKDYSTRFDNYFGGFPPFNISAFLNSSKAAAAAAAAVIDLLVDVYETDETVTVFADLPGVEKREDILIDIIDDRHLKISASRSVLSDFDGKRITQQERPIGRIERIITLPADVILEKTEALYKNGVLRVDMPKKTIGLEQKINIKFED